MVIERKVVGNERKRGHCTVDGARVVEKVKKDEAIFHLGKI
jgi:hypothetical protein